MSEIPEESANVALLLDKEIDKRVAMALWRIFDLGDADVEKVFDTTNLKWGLSFIATEVAANIDSRIEAARVHDERMIKMADAEEYHGS